MAARRTVRHGTEAFTFVRDASGFWVWSDQGLKASIYRNLMGVWHYSVRRPGNLPIATGDALQFKTILSRAAEAIVEQRREVAK